MYMLLQSKLFMKLAGATLLLTTGIATAGTADMPKVGQRADIAQFAQLLAGDNYIGAQ
jgi:hypothetical protein